MSTVSPRPSQCWRMLPIVLALLALLASACSSTADTATEDVDEMATEDVDETAIETEAETEPSVDDTDTSADTGTVAVDVAEGCDAIATLFVAGPSANADLPDPESSAVCDGDTVVVSANGIPDYTYIETSPGPPQAQDATYDIPATPVASADPEAVPLIGALGVTLAGIPIFGPTEGAGADVRSIDGIVMDCGGHNGPTGFHLHILGVSESSDCDFSPEEIASGPQLLGYAFDGYPIYTGNDQYSPSWELTDESLFASDTWGAHTYVEGSGDLDECNGITDDDGNYAYYTTNDFPYIIGCFAGELS